MNGQSSADARVGHILALAVLVTGACAAEPVARRASGPTAVVGAGFVAAPMPSVRARPAPAPAPAPAPDTATREIALARETTTTGKKVVVIGRPRLRVLPTCCRTLVLRTSTNRVLAVDDADVKQWDATSGVLVSRTSPSTASVPHTLIVVSRDGTWVAGGDEHFDLVHNGKHFAKTKLGTAFGFTTTNQLILRDRDGLALVDPATAAITQRLPKTPFPAAFTKDVAGDDAHVWWISERGYGRWDQDTDTFSAVTTATKEWEAAHIAMNAPVALIDQDGALYRLELSSGALTKIAKRSVVFDLSPSGTRAVLANYKTLRIVDATTGAEIAKLTMAASIQRVAFSEDDRTLAFVEGGMIRIADIDNGTITLRKTNAPSRFVGWEADGVARIEHEGTTQALEQSYWKAVGSPTGKTFAVWVRRPDVPPEPEPTLGDYGNRDPKCDMDPRTTYTTCLLAYVMELWSIDGPPTLLCRDRVDAKRDRRGRTWPYPKEASGPIAFTPDGTYVLFGFADGDVIIRATDASATSRIESLHRAPITRIEVAPGSKWVFTEDAEGEQRIWPL